jgi:hypothetical protein
MLQTENKKPRDRLVNLIEAEQKDSCITATLTINFAAQEVLQVMRNGGSLVGKCAASEKLKQPLVWKLITAD